MPQEPPVSSPGPAHPPTILAFMITTSWGFFHSCTTSICISKQYNFIVPVPALYTNLQSHIHSVVFLLLSFNNCVCTIHPHGYVQLGFRLLLLWGGIPLYAFTTCCVSVNGHLVYFQFLAITFLQISCTLLSVPVCVSVCSGYRSRNGIACQRVCISSTRPDKGQAVF